MTTLRLTLTGILILPLFALSHAVEAQQARVYRVGVALLGGPHSSTVDGLREGLRELGLEESKEFVLHVRDGKGDLKSVEAAARSLEGEKVDLIVAMTTSVTLAVKRATKSVPIVFYAGTDPVSTGLVESFRKPGGRLTGIHGQTTALTAKRLELLKEMVPRLRRVVTFYNPDNPAAQQSVKIAREAARELKLELVERPVASVEELRAGLRPPARGGGCLFPRGGLDGDQPGGADHREREGEEAANHAPRTRECRQGGAGRLWRELLHDRTTLGQARPARFAGREPRRHAGRAGRQIPLRHQPQDRKGPWPHDPPISAGSGG